MTVFRQPVDWRWPAAVAAMLSLLASAAWVATTLTAADGLVRLRNSLGARIGEPADFSWSPASLPPGFLRPVRPAPNELVAVVQSIGLATDGDGRGEFAAGVALSRDLMRAPKRVDGPVNATSYETYRVIVGEGRGYCADFVKAFTGMAIARGIAVRQWGFAFSGFGSGHTFNEVYDTSLGKWVMIDSFHSLYFVDPASREPLSVLEVHDRLLAIDHTVGDVAIVPIVRSRVPFRTNDLAVDYYRRGMPQLWLVWGSNPFDYETSIAGRVEQHLHRSIGQSMGLVTGRYPTIRVYPVGLSRRDYRMLTEARSAFLASSAFLTLSALLALYVGVGLVRSRMV